MSLALEGTQGHFTSPLAPAMGMEQVPVTSLPWPEGKFPGSSGTARGHDVAPGRVNPHIPALNTGVGGGTPN